MEKVKFLSSLKFRIILMVILVVIFSNTINILLASTASYGSITDIMDESMISLAQTAGRALEEKLLTVDSLEEIDTSYYEEIFGVIDGNGLGDAYIYAVDGNGTMIYHPTKEKIGQPVENEAVKGLVQALKSGNPAKVDTLHYVYKGAKKNAGYYITQDKNAIVVVNYTNNSAWDTHMSIVRAMGRGSVALCVTCIAVSAILAIRFTKPLERVTLILGNVADMNVVKDYNLLKLAKKKDETGMIAKSIIKVIDALTETVLAIKKVSLDIEETASVLNGKAQDTNRSIDQVEAAMGEISSGVSDQARDTEEVAENINTIVAQIEQTGEQVAQLNNNAMDMNKAGKVALDTLQDLVISNEETMRAINEIFEQAKLTNDSVSKIREATDLIASVADQTSLLSLNASIEAARAGEAGRGFEVVASEIQNLSKQTSESAERISAIVNDLIGNSEREMAIMGQVMEYIKVQNESVDKTDCVVKDVTVGIDKSVGGIQDIGERTTQMNKASGKVIDVISSLSSIAEENAASTQETSATITSIAGYMDEIADQCNQLKAISEKLEEKIGIFKIKEK